MRQQFATVGLDELAEGLAIAGPGPGARARIASVLAGSVLSPRSRLLKVQHRRHPEFIGESPDWPESQ